MARSLSFSLNRCLLPCTQFLRSAVRERDAVDLPTKFRRGSVLRLFADGLLSLARQWMYGTGFKNC